MASDDLSSMRTVFPWVDYKWFMLQKDASRLASREKAAAGGIFQINREDTKVDEPNKFIVMENISHVRQKVLWQAGLFIALEDDVKRLLEAVEDPRERLTIYKEQKDLLQYARNLNVGDHVGIKLPRGRRETFGKVKYVGPVENGAFATYFGIELSDAPLDPSVLKKDGSLFDCLQNRGVIVPVNCLKVHTRTANFPSPPNRIGISSLTSTAKSNDDSGVGVQGAEKPPVIKEGDVVWVYTKMLSGHGKSKWVKGDVVHIQDGKVAVDVFKEYGSVSNAWNGFEKHKKLLSSTSKMTVREALCYVKTLDQQDNFWHKAKKESKPKSYAGAVAEGISNPSPPREDKNLEQPSYITSTCSEMKENVWKTKNMSQERSLDDFASSSGSALLSYDASSSEERVSSLQNEGQTKHPGKAVRRSSSVTESKQNLSHQPKQWKQSGGKDSNSGNFMSSIIKNVLPGKRGDPPKFPFCPIHFEVLLKEEKVWTVLLEEFKLTKKWQDILIKEPDRFIRIEKLLKDWWVSLHEGHNRELQRFIDCLRTNNLHDLADHIHKTPENAAFDVSVVEAVAHAVGERWKILASHLPIDQQDLNRTLKPSYSSHAAVHIVFDIWQQKEAGCVKFWKLISACRETGIKDVAADIEQGLSEEYCRKLSRKIVKPIWKKLGGKLSIGEVRLDAFGQKFHDLAERVFHMLCYWSMTSSLDTNKADVLADALRFCNQNELAADLRRDLSEEDLQVTAALVDSDWTRLATHLSQYEIDDLLRKENSAAEKALLVLEIWKRRQPLDNKKLRKSLYCFLLDKKFYRAARQLYDGLDDETVVDLANKLCFEWTLLANHFGYAPGEISQRTGSSDQLNMSYIMLKEWIDANKENGTKETKTRLCDGLKAIGRDDLVKWLEQRLSDTVDENASEKHDSNHTKDRVHKSARLDRILIENIEKAVPHMKGADFMDLLNMSQEAVQIYLPQSVKYENNPVVAVVSAWKKKMSQNGHEEREIIMKLKELFVLYGITKAAAALPDLPSLPPEESSEQSQGAVGGAPAADLNVNSMVEVDWDGKKRPGVIQWIGVMQGLENHGEIAGIELEEGVPVGGTNGWFSSSKYFACEFGKGLFLPLSRCRPDSRFLSAAETNSNKVKTTEEDFGGVKCEPLEGHEKPPQEISSEHVGLFKGIQGDHNSCYMDVTLYSMFAFNDVFDAILNCDYDTKDEVTAVKEALRKTIVNPLRRNGFVRADYVLHFRDLLNCLSSMEGLRTEEKDPEEFIHALLQELLNAKPFLEISQGTANTMESFVYQIFLDKKDYLDIPTVQDLLHVSFLESDLKLTKVPECLIVQLPRYGKKYKLFDWIIPSLEMDIRLLIRDSPRPCSCCGLLAFVECRDCTPEGGGDDIIQSYCRECFHLTHEKTQKKHQTNPLAVPKKFGETYKSVAEHCPVEELAEKTEHMYEEKRMELFSVVCIETSHYVAFVKAGSGHKAKWIFFDSMADRRGDQHGYNVPEVTHLRNFAEDMGRKDLKDALRRSADLSKYLKRLLSDAYICFYRPIMSKMGSPTGRTMPSNVTRDKDISNRSYQRESNRNRQRGSIDQQHDETPTYANLTQRNPDNNDYSNSHSVRLEKNEIARQQKRKKTLDQENHVQNRQIVCHQNALSALPDKKTGASFSSEGNAGNARAQMPYSSSQPFCEKSPRRNPLLRPADLTPQKSHHCVDEASASQDEENEDMDVDLYSEEQDGFEMIHHPPGYSSSHETNPRENIDSSSYHNIESNV